MLNAHPQLIFKRSKQPDLVLSPEPGDSVDPVIVDSIPRYWVANDFEYVQAAIVTCDDTALSAI